MLSDNQKREVSILIKGLWDWSDVEAEVTVSMIENDDEVARLFVFWLEAKVSPREVAIAILKKLGRPAGKADVFHDFPRPEPIL